MVAFPGMRWPDVLEVLDVARSVGCRYWLEGGWCVDALVGNQTRSHRDVDLDFDGDFEFELLAGLGRVGYSIETDWRPNRVELVASGHRRVDLHPLVLHDDGSARQTALGGGWHEFEAAWFVTGSIDGEPVPCLSVEAQFLFHSGYEPRAVDHHDLAQLARLT